MQNSTRGNRKHNETVPQRDERSTSRRQFLRRVGRGVTVLAGGHWGATMAGADADGPGGSLLAQPDLEAMREWTQRVLEAGKDHVRIGKDKYPVYLPSGSGQYPAFWPRDAVWIVHSNLVPAAEIGSMLRVMALSQNGPKQRQLKHGLLVPEWAIADHILLDGGGAVFFPGTWSAGANQGKGRFGVVASQDPCYQFIEMAYQWCRKRDQTRILRENVDGVPFIERMKLAFDSPEHDPDTQLAHCSEATRSVAFNDAIVQTGYLLQGSVLRWRAARRLAFLSSRLGDAREATHYQRIAERIRENLAPTFWREEASGRRGWLLSATELGRRDGVRGTSLTLAFGALPEAYAQKASRTLVHHSTPPRYGAVPEEGQMTYQAHVRHLKAGEFWEETRMPKGQYQNGGYWSMFTGWYLRAIALTDPGMARKQAALFVEHLRRHNFHDGTDEPRGAPWEWIHPRGVQKGAKYLAGLTLPYRACNSSFDVAED